VIPGSVEADEGSGRRVHIICGWLHMTLFLRKRDSDMARATLVRPFPRRLYALDGDHPLCLMHRVFPVVTPSGFAVAMNDWLGRSVGLAVRATQTHAWIAWTGSVTMEQRWSHGAADRVMEDVSL